MLKRHEVQVLRRAEHTWEEVATFTAVSEKTARRIAADDPVIHTDDAVERARRQAGRPSKAEGCREVLMQALTENPAVRSVELLHRARLAGYDGGKTSLYALAQTLRVRAVAPLVRFEGLPVSFRSDFAQQPSPAGGECVPAASPYAAHSTPSHRKTASSSNPVDTPFGS